MNRYVSKAVTKICSPKNCSRKLIRNISLQAYQTRKAKISELLCYILNNFRFHFFDNGNLFHTRYALKSAESVP